MTFHSPLRSRVLEFIRQCRLTDRGDHVLVAVSGGPDSVALLHILLSLETEFGWSRLAVLHFDHQLRGEDSQRDKAFVQALAERFALPFFCRSEDVRAYQKKRAISPEMAARECRRRFFLEISEQYGLQKNDPYPVLIALGHTAQDQAEEVLLRLFRGTGSGGLVGMLPKTDENFIRPLLFAPRRDILEYLREQNISYREDFSNQDAFCQRNVLRLKVFPLLEKHFHSHVVETLYRHTRLTLDEENFLISETKARWASLCREETSGRNVLDLLSVLSLHPAMQRRIFRFAIEKLTGNLLGIYAVHIETVFRWVNKAASGKSLQLPHGVRVIREGEHLIFSKKPLSPAMPFHWDLPGPGHYDLPLFDVCLSLQDISSNFFDEKLRKSDFSALIDAQKVCWPLAIRSWKPGDRFRPLGFHGTKKLQDFFVDVKISRSERNRIPLLCDREKICWISGYRLDDRVKVTLQTRQVLVVKIRRKDGEFNVGAPDALPEREKEDI